MRDHGLGNRREDGPRRERIEPPITVVSGVVVPCLQALAAGTLIAVALGITVRLFGTSWARAGVWALCALVWITAVFGACFIGQERAVHVTPSWVARQRVLLNRPMEREEPEEEPWRVIRARPQRPMLGLETLDHAAPVVGPQARPEIEEAYRFVTALWPKGDISQATVCERFSRRLWDRYIGGSRRKRDKGKESARGLLDRAGLIRKEGGRWVIDSTLEEALSWNPELKAYAEAKAQIVRLGRLA